MVNMANRDEGSGLGRCYFAFGFAAKLVTLPSTAFLIEFCLAACSVRACLNPNILLIEGVHSV